MHTTLDYQQYAQECRQLAKRTPQPEVQQGLEWLAQAWEKLAKELDHKQGIVEPLSNGPPRFK
jgi:hypothetical protein